MCLETKEATSTDCIVCLRGEIADLKATILNLMGKLNVAENNVPPFVLDMASLVHLEMTHDERGVTAKRTVKDLGS